MELKQYINRAWAIYKKLLVKKAHLDSLSNVISKYGEREIETYPTGNSSETMALRWSELKKDCDELEWRLLCIDRETDEILKKLSNPSQYQVLYLRYVRRLSWGDIPEALHYSQQNVYKLHKAGLDELDRLTGYADWTDEKGDET